jgi:(4S)-4-hydroxy-5-phosphonooxypentane-2,3-dione isomerase
MIIRIVKMTFAPQHVEDFLKLFNSNKAAIGSFEGCTHLELWNDKVNPAIFFTCSHWLDESCLERYRNSELFNKVWNENKNYFAARPEAWTVQRM